MIMREDSEEQDMTLEHVLQNTQQIQQSLLKFSNGRGATNTLSLLKTLYGDELERLTLYGFNGHSEELKLAYGGWMKEYNEGKNPAPMPWRKE